MPSLKKIFKGIIDAFDFEKTTRSDDNVVLKNDDSTSLPHDDGTSSRKKDDSTLFAENNIGKKESVIQCIRKRSYEINEQDIPRFIEELKPFLISNKNGDYLNDYVCDDYFRFLDLRKHPDCRVVVIGDIHCDYKSLAAILLKLTVSEYDYFEKAYFVFMGDYLDRGSALCEPLLLLMDLKQILGERLIMLRGNHELISYNAEKEMIESRVLPQQSCPTLNEYCGNDKEFLHAFADFFRTLPTYVYLKTDKDNILLTHASVPRQIFFDTFYYDQNTGSIEYEHGFLYEQGKKAEESISDDSLKSKTEKMNNSLLTIRNKILFDMIWGDPVHAKEKYQVSGRFEFGSDQYNAYAKKNNITKFFRSHVPLEYGYEAFFDNRLWSIFSSGGAANEQAGYAGIEPAFAIIKDDGSYSIENSYIYRVRICRGVVVTCNIYSGELVDENMNKYMLNKEFTCSGDVAMHIDNLFSDINAGFATENDDNKSEE